MKNEALMYSYKASFDRLRVMSVEKQNVLALDKPEGTRLDLVLDVLKVHDESQVIGRLHNGFLHMSIWSGDGWKCIPGRMFIDAATGDVFRIIESTTYCGYDDEFSKEVIISGSCLDKTGAPSAAKVEETFMLEKDNLPLVAYLSPFVDKEIYACLDVLSRLGFFYNTMDLALTKNVNYSAELRFAMDQCRLCLSGQFTIDKLIDILNEAYDDSTVKGSSEYSKFFMSKAVVSSKFREPALKFYELKGIERSEKKPVKERSLLDLAEDIEKIDVENMFKDI